VRCSCCHAGDVKGYSGCAVEVHDSREQGSEGSSCWGAEGDFKQEKHRMNRSVGFGAPNKRKGLRRRPRTSDNEENVVAQWNRVH
jgi:hypothetical protein